MSPEGSLLAEISPTHCGGGLLDARQRFFLGPGMGVVAAGIVKVDE
jgi:hypothetical protein